MGIKLIMRCNANRFGFLFVFVSMVFSASEVAALEHVVRAGDTIAKVAGFYAVSQKALIRENNLKKRSKLKVDHVLIIPEQLLGNASQRHIIKKGDTLTKISKKYGVEQSALLALNNLSPKKSLTIGRGLAIPNPIGDSGPDNGNGQMRGVKSTPVKWAGHVKGLVESSEIVEGGVAHTVQDGQTLGMIAKAYRVSAKRLKRKNGISRKKPLKAGDVIFIAGAKRVVPVRTKKYKPHLVKIISIKKNKKLKLRLINKSGYVNQKSIKKLSRLLGYRRVNPRLVELLQRVAERFPGHAIEIISGYRKPNGKKHRYRENRGAKRSPHARGVAVDFRLQGISRELLYEYIIEFEKVGCGYYPNSVHVHLDVRKRKYLWTDISGRGESAHYVEPGEPGHWDTIKDTFDQPMSESER